MALGQIAAFSVTATGAGTLSYQWQSNSVSIVGATLPNYNTPAATASDSESTFGVVVTNAAGIITSNSATLTVSAGAAPTLTQQPRNLSVVKGHAATFSVTAAGTGTLNCQWQHNSANIAAATSASYTTPAATEAAQPVGLDLEIGGARQLPAALGFDPQRPFITGWRMLNPTQPKNFGVTFTVDVADMTASVRPGARMQMLDYLRYTDQFSKIVSVDATLSSITVADQFNTGTKSPGIGGSWRVLADANDPGAPGEFAYEAATSEVYVKPGSEDALSAGPVVAAQLSTLNNVSGVTSARPEF